MRSVSNTLKGVVTALAGVSGIEWLTYQNATSFVLFVGSLGGAFWAWWVMRIETKAEADRRSREAQASVDRNQRVLDAISNMQINQLDLAVMISRINVDRPAPAVDPSKDHPAK